MDDKIPNLPERIGNLEVGYSNLREDVSELKKTVQQGFREINTNLSERNKPNWNVIFGCLGIAGALYAAAIRPLANDASRYEKNSDTLAQAVLQQNGKIDALEGRDIEIETQFRGEDEMRNVQFATQQRMDALLWEKTFGTRYPSDAVYYPHISK